MLKELTAAEKARPYAKFYYQKSSPVPKETLAILDKGPMDASLATTIQQRNDLLKPGYLPAEIGYCTMPDGSGYVAMKIEMPDVTAEMIDWYFAWFGLESLRYKIWDPEAHYTTHVIEKDLKHRLDPGLSFRDRRYGTSIVVNEDIGGGAVDLRISFMSPEEYGYDMNMVKPPIGTINSVNLSLDKPGIPLATASFIYRQIPGGLEARARFWLGWNVADRKAVMVSDKVPDKMPKGLAYHCAKEYTNLAAILPRLYEENHRIRDRLEDFVK